MRLRVRLSLCYLCFDGFFSSSPSAITPETAHRFALHDRDGIYAPEVDRAITPSRPTARRPEVCPPVVIGPTRTRPVPLITCGSRRTTTARGSTGPRHAALRRLPTIQYT